MSAQFSDQAQAGADGGGEEKDDFNLKDAKDVAPVNASVLSAGVFDRRRHAIPCASAPARIA